MGSYKSYPIDSLYKTLGRIIKTIRMESNMSKVDLASIVGYRSSMSLARIESGKQKIPLHVLFNVCDALDVDVVDIVEHVLRNLR